MKEKEKYIIAILIFLVVINMILIATGNMMVIDNWIYSLIRHNEITTKILLFITNFGSVKYIVGICLLFLIFYKPKKELIPLYSVTIISTIINNLIKLIFRRPRPNLMGTIIPVLENTFSFPSGHAMATMTFYGFLIYMIYKKVSNKRLKIGLITFLAILIFTVCYSRIYIYVHYFSDVITGILISFIILYFFIKGTKDQLTKNNIL